MMSTFKGVPLDDEGGATVDGIHYQPSYVAAAHADVAETSEALAVALSVALAETDAPPPLACIDDERPAVLALPHGLHDGFSEALYHAKVQGLASKSALDRVRRSPAHYLQWLRAREEESSEALRFGQALHAAVLTPDDFDLGWYVLPDFGDCRKTANKALRAAFRAEHQGMREVSASDMRAIQGMRASLRTHPVAGRMLAGGSAELTMRWKDEPTGIECKGRVDYYVPRTRVAFDLKTTADARPDAFARSVGLFGYARQEAFYRDAFATLGEPLEEFAFVAVEKEEPYAVAVYVVAVRDVHRARATVRADLERLASCLEADEWPAYADEIQELEVPSWLV